MAKKLILRFSPVALLLLILLFQTKLEYYDVLILLVIIFNIILSYPFKSFDSLKKHYSLINYFTWLMFIIAIIFIRSLIFDYAVFAILLLRIFILMINYFKFRNFYIPATFINRLWALSFVIYLAELVLNSTHATKNMFIFLGTISGIEIILIIVLIKKWEEKSSLYSLLKWNNKISDFHKNQ